jgi:hypothetical protein
MVSSLYGWTVISRCSSEVSNCDELTGRSIERWKVPLLGDIGHARSNRELNTIKTENAQFLQEG